MEEVYIVSAARTPIGKFGGMLRHLKSSELAAIAMEAVIKRSNIAAEQFDEVIIGNVFQAGGKGNPARQAAIKTGLPVTVPSMTINKQCASGMRSIGLGYQQILADEADIIVAGGTESMSNVPHLVLDARWGKKMGALSTVDSLIYDGLECAMEGYHMGVTAENLAELYEISREEQDRFALASQQKAQQAMAKGYFDKEIVPVNGRGNQELRTDEHPQGTSLEKLQKLNPAFKKDGTVTAGNASGLNDGAAAVVLVSGKKVKELGLEPLARIRSVASAGVDPSIMGIGPVPATKKALEKVGMSIHDIDLFELNEAFSVQTLAVMRELGINEEKVNVNGGAIALGHPVGCSGARIVVTLLHELIRQQKQFGLASLCIGGGQGATMIIERV
ncbi:thiolase family protein [Peribacillus sp. Hz7]|uniref:thiolase family protein n=1 Tax=Peribacillus sp. Hz7 TaxID=3344873 RepID=UPI0035CC0FE0